MSAEKKEPGPVETLARLALQSERYTNDRDFGDAVDAVVGQPKYDAADDLLAALKALTPADLPPEDAPCHVGITAQDKCGNCQRIIAAQQALAKAESHE